MPDSIFMQRVREKLIGANVESGERDVGVDDLAQDIAGAKATEDYAVSVTNPPDRQACSFRGR